MKKRRRRYTKKRRIIELRLKILTACLVLLCGCWFLLRGPVTNWWERLSAERAEQLAENKKKNDKKETASDQTSSGKDQKGDASESGKDGTSSTGKNKDSQADGKDKDSAGADGADHAGEITVSNLNLTTDSIYTFMQGPKAWNSQTPWSGAWCEEPLAGSKFSVFGCGLCDLANIYSTISPYECSPLDMYYYAKEASDYSPGGGVGAIDWPFLKDTLQAAGFISEVRDKDASYEEFQKEIRNAMTAIVLVSCYNDNTYWTETDGHYVNIWSYNSETDEVFLADSGDPAHNRCWIPLRYIYDALKTAGSHQYLLVHSYKEENDTWKHTGIEADWMIPDYYVSKSQT